MLHLWTLGVLGGYLVVDCLLTFNAPLNKLGARPGCFTRVSWRNLCYSDDETLTDLVLIRKEV